ncbi:MAG: efflux RND transporter permease subunit [Bauldia sp.]|uniref:efflux RND transporter permease subunit n=1 Tax=Bauldia sp. TaxID=2575872 RepID=UPI001D2957B5|nr:efflux RND transporter permease subunit [Bauldia sp.]MCB1497916.1 efflux RND transporter permease subunit [Bauldia sp.]
MRRIVDYAIEHARLTLAILILLLLAGANAYTNIPKEAEPDIAIPIIYVSLSQQGISPEDAERLLVRPMESQLKDVSNVKEMRAAAFEGGGYVLLEFEAGFDSDIALQDIRAKVEDAKAELPADADEPRVEEVNLSEQPVVLVSLAGNLSERTLNRIAHQAQDELELIPTVLSAEINGIRDEVIEIIAEPMLLRSYGVSLENFAQLIARSNALVAAGALEGDQGRFAVKVPALIETPEDVLAIPLAATSTAAVTLGDVARVLPTFKDATSITRVDGQPALVIAVAKRSGANLIETVDAVYAAIDRLRPEWPDALEVRFLQDKSKFIRSMLSDLQNSVITAVLLVAVIILFTLGVRASLMIGIAVPFSFLVGVLGLYMAGLTMNIVVLFSLILAVGMLVDDAIIVSEFAERRMGEGMRPREAYAFAADRMTGPVVAATLTRVAAFSPLLFWPGIVGEFMGYLPLTLIATLSASLVAALIFTPTLGALIGRAQQVHHDRAPREGPYLKTVRLAVRHPGMTIIATLIVLFGVIFAYGKYGAGQEFFPDVEPDAGQVLVHARGNMSLGEKDALLKEVEDRILDMDELSTIYTRVGDSQRGNENVTEDVIGTIDFEFIDWQERRPAGEVMDEVRQRTGDLPGIKVEVTAPNAGPPTGKPIQVQLSGNVPEALERAAREVTARLAAYDEIRDLDDGLPLPGIDWRLEVDKAEAARYGIGVASVGAIVRLVTNGLTVTDYRPQTSDDPVDIIVRMPEDRRTLNQIDSLRIQTSAGSVPISNFVERVPAQQVGLINRVDGKRIVTVTANVAEGVLSADVQQRIRAELEKTDFGGLVTWKLGGEDEESAAAQEFLGNAFLVAVLLIFLILLAVFNKLSSVFLILSAIVLSTIGVIIGLLVMGQPFGIVMTGIGIIALAGVVTNNNIVLIDTYDRLRREGVPVEEAILRTGRERARPVMLTAVTAILGVLPIAFAVTIDFLNREVTQGAPSAQWWVGLSTAIVFGLGFATVLTLVVTPASLAFLALGFREAMTRIFAMVPYMVYGWLISLVVWLVFGGSWNAGWKAARWPIDKLFAGIARLLRLVFRRGRTGGGASSGGGSPAHARGSDTAH